MHEIARGPVTVEYAPDEGARKAIAAELAVVSVKALQAKVVVRAWLDGAELSGEIDAIVEQTCSVSLDEFDEPIRTQFSIRVVPAGSPHAPLPETSEIELDAEADDPPDVLDNDVIDVEAYVLEHLALELDP
ncbi:YceD family protein [Phenylobacterium immobile]|uniref:YceD family protein n=1 Tax=Phenylobacterium immobile TaxID=21 RepID=UPI000AAC3E23|nr:YceD family protein [Phenylobacterium immobile]